MDNRRKTYSVAEAKSGLSELLDRVEAGEEILITRRGRAIATVESAEVVKKSFRCPHCGRFERPSPKLKPRSPF